MRLMWGLMANGCICIGVIDEHGETIDFLLWAKRDKKAAEAFFAKAIKFSGLPICVTVDKSGTNKAALDAINAAHMGTDKIDIWQNKYLNNLIEQDHRFIKRRIITLTRGFRSFKTAAKTIMGVELVHMFHSLQSCTEFHKNQLISKTDSGYNLGMKKSVFLQFISLVA